MELTTESEEFVIFSATHLVILNQEIERDGVKELNDWS